MFRCMGYDSSTAVKRLNIINASKKWKNVDRDLAAWVFASRSEGWCLKNIGLSASDIFAKFHHLGKFLPKIVSIRLTKKFCATFISIASFRGF